MFREGQAHPLQNFPTQKSAIRVNSGFFIFNSQHLLKWCPVVKHNALTALSASHRDRLFRTIPRKTLSHLPPLSKGGGLTARHKLLFCRFLLAICPPFLYCKLFCRQDGGIVPHPHHQLDFPHYPTRSPTNSPNTKNPPFALNSGFFIFNFRYSLKWCS